MNGKTFLTGLSIGIVVLTVVFTPLSSQQDGAYAPWMDLNDDGIIDAYDLQLLALIYGTSGTPINKTERLLELEARIDNLNASLLADYYNKAESDNLFVDIAGDTMTGSLAVNGDLTINPTTRYYTIPGSAWLPYRDTYTVIRVKTAVYTFTVGTTNWYAAVNLPHGVFVTELRAWVYDNDAADISVYLYRHAAGTGSASQMAYVSSSGASTGYRSISDSTIVASIIDNQNYAYLLYGTLGSGNNMYALSQVRITYTITEPLP